MQAELTPAPAAGGVYIHFPFCIRKCRYCDFYSITEISLVPSFLQALETEIGLRKDPQLAFDTLYFGGGTPSLLAPEQTARVIEQVGRAYRLSGDAEVTLEANPGSVDFSRISRFRAAGVNRVNIGVQSFSDRNLRFLGRIHTAAEAMGTLESCRRAGFDNIGIDLIYGLPEQSDADWLADMSRAVSFRPQHLSCYMLTYEAGTPLDRLRCRKQVRPLSDQRVASLFRATVDYLAQNGYLHYEISNFAASRRHMSRHNRKYWNFLPYMGLGPAAHSYQPPVRRWNRADVAAYLRSLSENRLPPAGEEVLTRRQEMIEAVYLGLRQTDGMSLPVFKGRFGQDFKEIFAGRLNDLQEDGLLRTTAERCALTPEGMLFLDTVAGRLVLEL